MDPKFEETRDILSKGGFVTELVTPPDQAHFGNWTSEIGFCFLRGLLLRSERLMTVALSSWT
jgi:hypothetical protein